MLLHSIDYPSFSEEEEEEEDTIHGGNNVTTCLLTSITLFQFSLVSYFMQSIVIIKQKTHL